MNKIQNKRGQFYLIAAMIIIIIILGFVGVKNFVKKEPPTRIYDLSDELGIEGEQVLNYGTVNSQDKLSDFLDQFSSYAGDNKDFTFIFGDSEGNIYLATYLELTKGEVSIQGLGEDSLRYAITTSNYDINPINDYIKTEGEKKTVTIRVGDEEYPFDLSEKGTNFYFLIREESGGDVNVVKR